MIYFLILLNLGISWLNAWPIGRSWVESRMVGGFVRFMAWMVATMAAVGFTWSYVVIMVMVAAKFQLLPPAYVTGMMSLGYLAIIIPAIGSGLAMTIQSWAVFYKNRTLGNGTIAGWNTFAQIHNMYEAASAIPEALSGVGKMFSDNDDDDSKGKLALLVVGLVVMAVVGGILTARAIILNSARNVAREYKTT